MMVLVLPRAVALALVALDSEWANHEGTAALTPTRKTHAPPSTEQACPLALEATITTDWATTALTEATTRLDAASAFAGQPRVTE